MSDKPRLPGPPHPAPNSRPMPTGRAPRVAHSYCPPLNALTVRAEPLFPPDPL